MSVFNALSVKIEYSPYKSDILCGHQTVLKSNIEKYLPVKIDIRVYRIEPLYTHYGTICRISYNSFNSRNSSYYLTIHRKMYRQIIQL